MCPRCVCRRSCGSRTGPGRCSVAVSAGGPLGHSAFRKRQPLNARAGRVAGGAAGGASRCVHARPARPRCTAGRERAPHPARRARRLDDSHAAARRRARRARGRARSRAGESRSTSTASRSCSMHPSPPSSNAPARSAMPTPLAAPPAPCAFEIQCCQTSCARGVTGRGERGTGEGSASATRADSRRPRAHLGDRTPAGRPTQPAFLSCCRRSSPRACSR